LLALTLALQTLVHFRNLLADAWPQAHPFVKAVCAAVHCSVEPVRRIEDIVIDSSALTAAASGEAVRLSLVLRNRGTQPLAMPSVELTITDADGKMLVRRALSPSDFAVASATLPASAETPLQLVLATGGRRASSYTIEPFYP
jgi:hypothetical protein